MQLPSKLSKGDNKYINKHMTKYIGQKKEYVKNRKALNYHSVEFKLL